LIAGLLLPMGVIHAQDTGPVTATCKDGTAFTGTKRSGACRGHGGVQSWAQLRRQLALSLHLPRLQPRRTPAPVRASVAALGKSGSILPARFITAPAIAGTARPSTAATCPKRRHGRRASGRTMARLAPRRPI
jgi:hypothetical protein